MKRRGFDLWRTNQIKLSNNSETELSDRNLLELMINQFIKWKNSNLNNILFINYKDCFDINIKITIQNFLNNENLNYLPFIFKKPKTVYDINNIDNRLKKIFEKHKEIIEETSK